MLDKKRVKRRAALLRPLLLPLLLYLALLALAVSQVPSMAPTPLRYVVALLPIVPGLYVAFGIVRMAAKIDEMERRVLLEAVTFSFILTLIFLFSAGLLGLAGVPQPSPIITAAIMCFLVVVGKLWSNWRYR